MKNSAAQTSYIRFNDYQSESENRIESGLNDIRMGKVKSRLSFVYFISLIISVLVLFLR